MKGLNEEVASLLGIDEYTSDEELNQILLNLKLIEAVSNYDKELCKKLIEEGANPDFEAPYGEYAPNALLLIASLPNDDVELAKIVSTPTNLHSLSGRGDNAIHLAARVGNPLIIEYLKSMNVAMDVVNDNEESTMDVALNAFHFQGGINHTLALKAMNGEPWDREEEKFLKDPKALRKRWED